MNAGYAPSETARPVDAEVTTAPPAVPAGRLDSLDFMRGFVMVLMALDHVRHFMHIDEPLFNPLDLAQTNVPLFFTRWITHIAAPIFVFLAGMGAFLYGMRGRSRRQVSGFLLSRGIWLIFLELTVIKFGWDPFLNYYSITLQVIWILGVSMIILAALVYLPVRVIGAIGLVLILGHNLFDGISPDSLGALRPVWLLLHNVGMFELLPGVRVYVSYPLIPWVGVMAAGYSFGQIYTIESTRRRKLLIRTGLALTAAFLVLRAINLYGDPVPWSVQPDPVFTFLSFLNTEKYPPSLLFLLMTLGPAILMLGLLPSYMPGKLTKPIVTFGRVPLFFYIIHLPFIHFLPFAAAFLFYDYSFHDLVSQPLPRYNLLVVYIVFVLVVLVLYPVSLWFAGVKKRSRNPLLRYL